MSKHIKLRKGFDIKLVGEADKIVGGTLPIDTFAVKPASFHGIDRPKVLIEEGDKVKAGTPLMIDKKNDRILHSSPVSGEVQQIVRGEKRKLLEIVIKSDGSQSYEEFKKHSVSELNNLSRDEAVDILLKGGLWPSIVQRPFGVIADPDETPKAIFVSGFDSSPLAPDYNFLIHGEEQSFQAGIEVAKKLSGGHVHLTIDGQGEVSQVYSQPLNIQLHKVSGPHPSGNVGVHIHHFSPINKGDLVWTIDPLTIVQMGKLFLEGHHDAAQLVAIAGPEVKEPKYYKTYRGAKVEKLLENNLHNDHVRVISGNVLTGENIGKQGYLNHFDRLVTVVEEGDNHEAFGWVLPQPSKPSFHRALGLLSFLTPNKKFKVNTNTNGEPRAFVQTGIFERVLPMDILPTYLLKAILAEDYDEIEGLGIFEVIEEDMALCEFVDVSKHDVQEILREGLELIRHS